MSNAADNAEAGPSRRPRGPHPSGAASRRSTRKLRPPAPAPPPPIDPPRPTLPIKVLQGMGVRRTDTQRPGFGRDVIFVTRKTKLGALLGRARRLILDEGYTHITLYALGAAVSHALLLLHALLDILPFPSGPGGVWYELQTGSVTCRDEVAGTDTAYAEDEDEFPGLGAVAEDAPQLRERTKSSLRIEIHVEPRREPVVMEEKVKALPKRKANKPARPSAKRRHAATVAAAERKRAHRMDVDEEDAMNG